MNSTFQKTWSQYEAGREYNRRIGLYEAVRRNERFYRGEQWQGNGTDLPRPVFNLIRLVTDHLVGTVLPGDLSIRYCDDRLPFLDNSLSHRAVCEGLALLERNAAYRYRRDHLHELLQRALLDAALTGDAVLYCRWDGDRQSGQPFLGEICTDLIPNTELFVADVNQPDLQAQDYVILAGRATVESLRREAREAGVDEKDVARILPDGEEDAASDLSRIEQDGAQKATFLVKFYREEGEVVFERSTRSCLLRRERTALSHYPVVSLRWNAGKDSFHGTPLVSEIIPNQIYINTAYAMMMKHMRDTAFSKIVYDKSRIPEWSNEVGEAIAAVGGGSVADAVSVVGVGEMQSGYAELIERVIEITKEMQGATNAALGNTDASNTSAILALQEASRLSLAGVRSRLCRAVAELATVWADMLCAYSPAERLLPYEDEDGLHAKAPDYALLRGELIRASVEIGETSRYTPASTVSTLNHLLSEGQITLAQYLKSLPNGTLACRDLLLREISQKGYTKNE